MKPELAEKVLEELKKRAEESSRRMFQAFDLKLYAISQFESGAMSAYLTTVQLVEAAFQIESEKEDAN
jgi:hypothetical protein